ncbi:MAG TPA: glycosyltransferase family 2 protein [Blastocatellia bacterium]|nr:glycosyltransferase family 2 protein [Blastocatellia bacterium]
MSEPRVYIIILNWNNYEDTKKCVESVEQATYPDLKIIIVDNASTDGSGERLQKEFSQHQFVLNEGNLGFSKGCNRGIRVAMQDKDCAYVLLLNNDAVVTADFLEKAVESAERDSRIGLVGGKIFNSLESKVIAYAGGHMDFWRGMVVIRGFGEEDRGQYDGACEVGFVTGAFMLIKREVLEKVGLLPEEYFFGVEEWDYSYNVQQHGYKLYYVPEFVAYHMGDGSHWNYDARFAYIGSRSRLIFQQKYLPKALFPLWKLMFYAYLKFSAKRSWQKLSDKYDNEKEEKASFDDMQFAYLKGIEDHGKDDLTEETLLRFGETLNKRKKAVVK